MTPKIAEHQLVVRAGKATRMNLNGRSSSGLLMRSLVVPCQIRYVARQATAPKATPLSCSERGRGVKVVASTSVTLCPNPGNSGREHNPVPGEL